jgi:hypothetical protein
MVEKEGQKGGLVVVITVVEEVKEDMEEESEN